MIELCNYYCQTVWRWILRISYSRGFGIQSPSAYSFVRYVINEHYPYYAYEELDRLMNSESRKFRKIGRLIFRIANYWQPQIVLIDHAKFSAYIHKGCNRANVKLWNPGLLAVLNSSIRSMVIIDVCNLKDVHLLGDLWHAVSDNMLLVLLGIHRRHEDLTLWREFIADDRCSVTYDLYLCGIVFFDRTKHKQNFKINF